MWRSRGINAAPAVVVEGKWLVSGGQPAEVFEEALRGWRGRVRRDASGIDAYNSVMCRDSGNV